MSLEPLREKSASVLGMQATRTTQDGTLTLVGAGDEQGAWLTRLTTSTFERLCLRWLEEVGIADLDLRDQWGTGLLEGTGQLKVDGTASPVFLRCLADTRPTTPADIRNLRLVLGRHGDRGLYVTSGEITAEARAEAVAPGHAPVLLVDGHQFLDCLMAAGDVVCHVPSNTWMVVDRDHRAEVRGANDRATAAPVAVAV